MVQALHKQYEQQAHNFNLPEPYCNDVWDVQSMDIYINATDNIKNRWKLRSSKWNYKFDFSICNNKAIREELKYFCYQLLIKKKISIATFAEYCDKFALLYKFINANTYSSIVDVDIDDYSNFIVDTGHKRISDNGTYIAGNKTVSSKKANKLISVLAYIQETLKLYYDSLLPLMDRDLWLPEYFVGKETSGRKINFESIKQDTIKKQCKVFAKLKIENNTFDNVSHLIYVLTCFSEWLYDYDSSIKSFAEINRDDLEEYFVYLRLESGFSSNKANDSILTLRNFIATGLMLQWKDFSNKQLITKNDYTFKGKTRTPVYSETEMNKIVEVVSSVEPIYAEVLVLLITIGCRVNELLKMKQSMITCIDGQYYLSLYMHKTKRDNDTPVSDGVAKIILKRIKHTKESFPDSDYVFVKDNGYRVEYSTFIKKIKKIIIENNILDDNGDLLQFRTHSLRATKATNLLMAGYSAESTAQMLGHKNLDSLSHYITVSNKELWGKMKPLLDKETVFINSIGEVDHKSLMEYEVVQPLCNGFCCRSITLGACDKANACLNCKLFKPSREFITDYKNQLVDINALIALAEANDYPQSLENNLKTKESLERIIREMEEMRDE